MTQAIKFTLKLTQLCLLWALVRSVQFILKRCGYTAEADAVSNAELYLQCDIRGMAEDPIKERLLGWVG